MVVNSTYYVLYNNFTNVFSLMCKRTKKNLIPNYFTFTELIKTSTGVSNYPSSSYVLNNLSRLWFILNMLRDKFGNPIYVNSCYRCPDVNKAVGGVEDSFHIDGLAADIRTLPHLMDEFRFFLNNVRYEHPHLFVEFIDKGTFIHIAI